MKINWARFKYADLLVCYWNDIVSSDSWISQEEAGKTESLECVSVGWLLNQDAMVIRLASTIGDNDDVGGVIVIPKGVITKVKRVIYNRKI
jgi:hypothetical protein